MKYWCIVDISGKSKRFVTAHRDRERAERQLKFSVKHFSYGRKRFVMEQVDERRIPRQILEASGRHD